MNGCFKFYGFIFFALFLSNSNAITLGQITVADPVMGNRTVIYEQINDYGVVEGDILIDKIKNLQNRGAVITRKVGGSRWKHGIVPFEIDEELPFVNKLAVLQAIEHWQQHSKIEFVELNSKNRYKYPDFISFIPAEGTTCSSFVGRHGGKQIISLAPRCNTMNTVHELGHALGLWHEQSRADRDSYVRIVWENIVDEYKYNFNQKITNGKDFGKYDYLSIMHYPCYAFSKNGQKTIIPLVDGVEIGQRKQLSEKDIAAINAMYPEL